MIRLHVFLLIVVLLVALSLVGGSMYYTQGSSADLEAPKEVQVTEKGGACGSGVGLNAGDTLVLILEGNPSTGNAWEVGFHVPAVISPVGEPEYQPGSSQIGAGGTVTFRFLAVGEGEAIIRMIYRRPWEKDVPALKTCEVTVIVK